MIVTTSHAVPAACQSTPVQVSCSARSDSRFATALGRADDASSERSARRTVVTTKRVLTRHSDYLAAYEHDLECLEMVTSGTVISHDIKQKAYFSSHHELPMPSAL